MEQSSTYKNAYERIKNMPARLNSVLHAILPHMSDATNGIVNKIGIVSVATAGTTSVVTTAIQTQDPTWITLSSLTGVLSAIGAAAFTINIIVRAAAYLYFERRKDKREQEDHNLKIKQSKE